MMQFPDWHPRIAFLVRQQRSSLQQPIHSDTPKHITSAHKGLQENHTLGVALFLVSGKLYLDPSDRKYI